MSYEHDYFHPDRQRIFKVIPDLIASSGTNINELKLIGDFSSMPAIPPTTDTSFYANSVHILNPEKSMYYIGGGGYNGGFGVNWWTVPHQDLGGPGGTISSREQQCGIPMKIPKEPITINNIEYPQTTHISASGTVEQYGAGSVEINLLYAPCFDEGATAQNGDPIGTVLVPLTHLGKVKLDPVTVLGQDQDLQFGTYIRCWEIPRIQFPNTQSHSNLIYIAVGWNLRGGGIKFPDGQYKFTFSIKIENEGSIIP